MKEILFVSNDRYKDQTLLQLALGKLDQKINWANKKIQKIPAKAEIFEKNRLCANFKKTSVYRPFPNKKEKN